MKKNKMRVTVYGLLPVTLGLSAANVALAEDELQEITVEETVVQSGAAQSQTVRKTIKKFNEK